MEKIEAFEGRNRFLSNFWPCTVDWYGLVWPSAEHAYQAAKTEDKNQIELIRTAPTPGSAKRLGKRVHMRPDWDKTKDNTMYSIVWAKFAQNEQLRAQLLETGTAILEEGNYWHDRYWGISPAGSGQGQNKLGLILMRVRRELAA